MNATRKFSGLLFGALLALFCAGAAAAADLKLEAQLIWASSEAKSPNPKHKPVDADVQQKLASLPLKWTHFFEENRQPLVIPEGAAQRADLSDKSAVEVKHLAGDKIQVTLFGNGKEIWKGTQPLPKNEILIIAGNAPADSAWLVALKRRD
jgi:hypothetical protein